MMPEWKSKSGDYGRSENIKQVMNMHIEKCYKTAMILHETMALQLFAIMKSRKLPVFLGKDIINEQLCGYMYMGYFPQSILLRFRVSFRSGFIAWWKNHVKWFLILKTRNDPFLESRNATIKSLLNDY